ncbi:hypothetical protein ACFSRY_18025 [Pontibacter locisalis]|uniref:Four helix bundle sensory module for signal transduction n=2 Tax=Pontibacter locisalis TaxID=1719035 RepID=A0ABW5IQW5_9BACT
MTIFTSKLLDYLLENKMKKLLVIVFLCIACIKGHAQDDKLTRLMNEREQLVMEYQYYNQQNSNFWGKKSKKDLLHIIETLKKIINTDSELIAAVKEATIKQMAASTVESQREGKIVLEDQRIIDSRISGLQSQVKTLQSQLKKREREIADLNEQIKESYNLRYGKDKVITILAVVAFVLLLYAVFLQVRLNKAATVTRKKKKA